MLKNGGNTATLGPTYCQYNFLKFKFAVVCTPLPSSRVSTVNQALQHDSTLPLKNCTKNQSSKVKKLHPSIFQCNTRHKVHSCQPGWFHFIMVHLTFLRHFQRGRCVLFYNFLVPGSNWVNLSLSWLQCLGHVPGGGRVEGREEIQEVCRRPEYHILMSHFTSQSLEWP